MQCELDGGFQEAQLIAGVIARAFKTVAVNGPVAEQVLQRVGELDLAAASWLDGSNTSGVST